MRQLVQSSQFKKDFKKASKNPYWKKEDILQVVELLAKDIPLPERFKDHVLIGNYAHCRECHIKPDWLLIYSKEGEDILNLIRTGTHSELFCFITISIYYPGFSSERPGCFVFEPKRRISWNHRT